MPERPPHHKISRRLIFCVVGVLAVFALTAQAFFIRDLYARIDRLEPQTMKDVLVDAVTNLNKEPVPDPTTGRLYIPSSRLVLPANVDARFYYRSGGEATTLMFVDVSSQAQAIAKMRTAPSLTDTFKELSGLQVCSRQVVVSFDAPNPQDSSDKLTLKNTKKLKDGRTAYIYQNECPYGAEALLKTLDQMESF